jgi:ATP synthase protein I
VPFNRPIPESKPQAKNFGATRSLAEAEKLIQIAILLPSSAFIGWLVGAWLGGRLHQTWMGLAGILFGGISGLVYVVRLAMAGMSRAGSSAGDEKKSGSTGSEP